MRWPRRHPSIPAGDPQAIIDERWNEATIDPPRNRGGEVRAGVPIVVTEDGPERFDFRPTGPYPLPGRQALDATRRQYSDLTPDDDPKPGLTGNSRADLEALAAWTGRQELRRQAGEVQDIDGDQLPPDDHGGFEAAARRQMQGAAAESFPDTRGGAMSRVARECRGCGCTDDDCSGCIERTGSPCQWQAPGVCTACVDLVAAVLRAPYPPGTVDHGAPVLAAMVLEALPERHDPPEVRQAEAVTHALIHLVDELIEAGDRLDGAVPPLTPDGLSTEGRLSQWADVKAAAALVVDL